MASAPQARLLEDYARRGGVVLVIGQLAMRDDNGNYLPEIGPGFLRECLGVDCVGGMYLAGGCGPDGGIAPELREHIPVGFAGALRGVPFTGRAERWIGDLRATTATVLATFTEDAYAGQPAFTAQTCGRGMFLWLGVAVCPEAPLGQVIEHALTQAGVPWRACLPTQVEIQRRGTWLFAINHGSARQTIEVGSAGRVVIGERQQNMAQLPPYGVVVIDPVASTA